jgi:hypothetical protein
LANTTNAATIRTNLGLGATNYPVIFEDWSLVGATTMQINGIQALTQISFGGQFNFEERQLFPRRRNRIWLEHQQFYRHS